MAARKQSAVDKGRAIQQSLLDKASDVYESTKRVQQLSLPMASGTKAGVVRFSAIGQESQVQYIADDVVAAAVARHGFTVESWRREMSIKFPEIACILTSTEIVPEQLKAVGRSVVAGYADLANRPAVEAFMDIALTVAGVSYDDRRKVVLCLSGELNVGDNIDRLLAVRTALIAAAMVD